MNIAIVSGASSGMGKEFVSQISKKVGGLDEIWVIARRTERLEQLKKENSIPLIAISMDLSDMDNLSQLKCILKGKNPNVKMLVNCAGYAKVGEFNTVPYEEELGMVQLNCLSLTAMTYLILPFMKKGARIIQLASSAAFFPIPEMAVYAASKAYVLSFSRALGVELKPRQISVTSVCPGPVATEFFEVAETTKKLSGFIKLFMASPQNVVEKAMTDAAARRSISIYGYPLKLLYGLTKFLPHQLLMKIVK